MSKKGYKQSEEHRARIAAANTGKKWSAETHAKRDKEMHHNWKGDKVTYWGIHKFIAFHKGRPRTCEHCKRTDAKIYDWANKSHEYKRDLDDWIRLCRKCHIAYDGSASKNKKLWNTVRKAN